MFAVRNRLGTSFLFVALAGAVGFAQTSGGGGSSGGGGGSKGTPTRGTTPTAPSNPSQQQQQMPRPIFLSGAVVMADGSPVPTGVEIVRVCGARNHREAYADSTGHFGFQVGQNTMIPDAATNDISDYRIPGSSGMGTGMGMSPGMGSMQGAGMTGNELMGCELKASAPGYISSSVDLSSLHTGLDDPNVGTIVLERMEKVPGTMVSATTYSAPKDAQKAFKKGLEDSKKGRFDEANKKFEEATQGYPKFAEAWYQMGLVYQRENQPDAARKAYQQAIDADSKFVNPYIQMASLEAMGQNWPASAKFSDEAIALDPINFAGAYFFSSVAHFNMGQFEQAETNARKAQHMDQQHRLPQIELLLGRILMVKKDFTGAISNLKDYLARSPNAPDADTIRRQLETLQQASAGAPAPAAAPANRPR